MYEYFFSALLIILAYFIIFFIIDVATVTWIRPFALRIGRWCAYLQAPQRTMEHMVGRLATKFIEKMLEQVRQKIITEGYENWAFDLFQKEFTFTELFSCNITAKNVLVSGASKFVTNNVSYDVTTARAIFDISVPKLYLGIGDAGACASINVVGMDFETQLNGWITVVEPRVTGSVVLVVDDAGHVSASSVDINIQLQEIQSKIHFTAMETDYSEAANNFFRTTLPDLINNYVNSCKAAIEIGLMSIANPILAQMF